MNGFGGFKEKSDMNDLSKEEKSEIGSEVQKKFDKLMGDDRIQDRSAENKTHDNGMTDIEEKFENLFLRNYESEAERLEDCFDSDEIGNPAEKQENKEMQANESAGEQQDNISIELLSRQTEPNSKYEIDGETYETDDSGKIYKKNGELLPNTDYTINGNKYRTNENGNPVFCDSEPSYTEEGIRNLKEQRESGGEGRQEDDDGGHIIAKVLGGAEGAENLVPMRRTINRGDYKKMENEISKALQEGKKVTIHIDLEYNGDSSRPTKIKAAYLIDGIKTDVAFDNNEKSTELLGTLDQKISDEDYESLKEELADMNTDSHPAAVTSVKTEYDENGSPYKITVGVLDETTGIKSYKVYQPKGDA